MSKFLIDMVGYTALGINLYSMSTKGEYKLRIISAIANSIYIVYGILMGAKPLIIGCTIAVGLHLYRIYKIRKGA